MAGNMPDRNRNPRNFPTVAIPKEDFGRRNDNRETEWGRKVLYRIDEFFAVAKPDANSAVRPFSLDLADSHNVVDVAVCQQNGDRLEFFLFQIIGELFRFETGIDNEAAFFVG